MADSSAHSTWQNEFPPGLPFAPCAVTILPLQGTIGEVVRSLAIVGARPMGAEWGRMEVELGLAGAALCSLWQRSTPFLHVDLTRLAIAVLCPRQRSGDAKATTA